MKIGFASVRGVSACQSKILYAYSSNISEVKLLPWIDLQLTHS